ncbi:2-keto-4-pentenoate hydratase [bacterium]|nr:2-keto-4-pentenoate hydratase [bacterium]
MTDIQQAAERLWQASKSKQVCEPIRDLIGPQNIEDAYKTQAINTEKRIAEGAKKVGCKIGLTSFAVQKQLGVDQPDYGMLFQDMQINPGETIAWNDLIQGKAEAEIAFVMKSGIEGEINADSFKAAIDYASVSIEIVGSRVRDWDIKIADTIADNASASHFVLGNEKVDAANLDLVNCTMQLKVNGEIASEGKGEACMGSPLNAAVWLAKTMADLGAPLSKGDIILTGALGPMVALKPGDQVSAKIEGLGEVNFNVGQHG